MTYNRKHYYNNLSFTLWPFLLSTSLFSVVYLMVFLFNKYYILSATGSFFLLAVFLVFFLDSIMGWVSEIREEAHCGKYTKKIRSAIVFGFILFLLSEIMLFGSFFWVYFDRIFHLSYITGFLSVPSSVELIRWFKEPLYATLVLITSGYTSNYSYYLFRQNNLIQAYFYSVLTNLLGCVFLYIQYMEYSHLKFTISDTVYCAIFFLLTGFHGVHVIVGNLLLFIQYWFKFKEGNNKLLGLTLGLVYWHFVDFIWIFLFIFVYLFNNLDYLNLKSEGFIFYTQDSNYYFEEHLSAFLFLPFIKKPFSHIKRYYKASLPQFNLDVEGNELEDSLYKDKPYIFSCQWIAFKYKDRYLILNKLPFNSRTKEVLIALGKWKNNLSLQENLINSLTSYPTLIETYSRINNNQIISQFLLFNEKKEFVKQITDLDDLVFVGDEDALVKAKDAFSDHKEDYIIGDMLICSKYLYEYIKKHNFLCIFYLQVDLDDKKSSEYNIPKLLINIPTSYNNKNKYSTHNKIKSNLMGIYEKLVSEGTQFGDSELGIHEQHVLVNYLNKNRVSLIENYKNERAIVTNDVGLIDSVTGEQTNIELKARSKTVDCFNDANIINMKYENDVIAIVTSDQNAFKYEDYNYLRNITLEKVNKWYQNLIYSNFKKLDLTNFTTVDRNYDDEWFNQFKNNKNFSLEDKNTVERLFIRLQYNVKPYDPSNHKKIINLINDSSLSKYYKSNLKYKLDLLKKFYIISNKSSFNTEKERSLWISEHFPKAWIKQIKERFVETSYNNEFIFSNEAKVLLLLNDLLLKELNRYLDEDLFYYWYKNQIDKSALVKELLHRLNLDLDVKEKVILNIKEKIIDEE